MDLFLRLRSLAVMARPHNGLICALVLVAGQLGSSGPGAGWPVPHTAWLAAGALFLLCSCAHLVNDVVDLPADRSNRPQRPLPAGKLTANLARWAILVLLLTSLFMVVGVWAQWGLWWLVWASGGVLYSLFVKGRHPLTAPLWTALVIASCWMAGASREGINRWEWSILALMVWFVYYREVVKGVEDSRGDLLAGYLTCSGRFPATRSGFLLLSAPLVLGGIFLAGTATTVWSALLSLGIVLTLVWSGIYLVFGPTPWVSSAGSLLKWTAGLGVGLLVLQRPGW